MKVRRIYCEDKPWTLGRTIFWSHFGWNAWQLACNEFLHMLQLQHAIQKPLRKPHEPPRHLGKKAWLPCSFSLERSIEPKERQLVLSVLLNLIPDSRLVLIATAFRRGNNFPCYYWLAVVFYSNPQQKSWWISFFFGVTTYMFLLIGSNSCLTCFYLGNVPILRVKAGTKKIHLPWEKFVVW